MAIYSFKSQTKIDLHGEQERLEGADVGEVDRRIKQARKRVKKIRKLILHLNRYPEDDTAYKALNKFTSSEIILVLMTLEEKFAELVVKLITTKPSYGV